MANKTFRKRICYKRRNSKKRICYTRKKYYAINKRKTYKGGMSSEYTEDLYALKIFSDNENIIVTLKPDINININTNFLYSYILNDLKKIIYYVKKNTDFKKYKMTIPNATINGDSVTIAGYVSKLLIKNEKFFIKNGWFSKKDFSKWINKDFNMTFY